MLRSGQVLVVKVEHFRSFRKCMFPIDGVVSYTSLSSSDGIEHLHSCRNTLFLAEFSTLDHRLFPHVVLVCHTSA